MKSEIMKYLLPMGAGFVVLGVILFFLNPYAPLILVASILIQAPIVWFLVTSSYRNSYRERSEQRKLRFEKDSDANKWLEEEEKESRSIGRKYWSKSGNALSILNRTEALLFLERNETAKELWATLEINNVGKQDKKRFETIAKKIENIE